MPLINHINQSSQIFRPNENRWDVRPSLQFVDANTLEPVTSYNEGDSVTIKFDFAPRGVPALEVGYDYQLDQYYYNIAVGLTLKNLNGVNVSTSGQFTITYNYVQVNVVTGQPNNGVAGWSGYLAYGQIKNDLRTDGPLIIGTRVTTSTRAPGNSYYSSIILDQYVDLLNDNVIINDTSTFPIPKASTITAYSGDYITGNSISNTFIPHPFTTTYTSFGVQHLLTPSRLTNDMGLTSGAVIKGFGMSWRYTPAPSSTYQNLGTQIWIFHADRENFGEYYSDTGTTYYNYSNYQAAPISGESKNLIFGLSSTEKEILTQQPDSDFAFGYYDYQLNTNLCSTSFTWNGTDAICIEACSLPKNYYVSSSAYNMRQTMEYYKTNPNTGSLASLYREYGTAYIATYGGNSNYCGVIPTSRSDIVPQLIFYWD